MSEYHWEIAPLTYGRARVIWTDGASVEDCVLTDSQEPELMYKMIDDLFYSLEEVLKWLGGIRKGRNRDKNTNPCTSDAPECDRATCNGRRPNE